MIDLSTPRLSKIRTKCSLWLHFLDTMSVIASSFSCSSTIRSKYLYWLILSTSSSSILIRWNTVVVVWDWTCAIKGEELIRGIDNFWFYPVLWSAVELEFNAHVLWTFPYIFACLIKRYMHDYFCTCRCIHCRNVGNEWAILWLECTAYHEFWFICWSLQTSYDSLKSNLPNHPIKGSVLYFTCD